MQPPTKDNQFYEFKSRNQERIFKLFRDLLGEGLSAFYRDACILMEPKTKLDSSVHLVGHLFRELEGQLRSVLVEPGAGTEEAKGFGELGVADDVTALTNCQCSVNTENCTNHRDQISNILGRLGIPLDHAVAKSWFKLTQNKKLRLPGYAHNKVLGRIKTWDRSFERIVQEWQEVFLFVLERFQECYVTYHKRLDELLRKEIPESEDIRRLRESIPNNIHAMHYFFDRIDKPGWLLPLEKKGFFVGPSDPEPEPETGHRVFPRWPPGPYLIRMAAVKPGDVMDILLVVEDRLNPYVLYHLTEAATKMPHKEAARIVPKVKGWLRLNRDYSFMLDCAELVEYLARGGCVDESLDLARELLSVSPRADRAFPSSQLVWNYDQVVKKIAPTLIDISGLEALRLFCDLLGQALTLAWGNSDKTEGRDHSYMWRTQIELTPERGHYELDDAFVTAVRDCSVRLVRNEPALLPSVMDHLEGRRWLVFQRLALHLLCEFPTESIELIPQRLKKFRRYNNRHFHNEYYRLALNAFPLLKPADQNDMLNAIKEGPDLREVQRRLERREQEITDEAMQLEIRKSVRNCLGELRPVLNRSWLSFLEELERDLGDAKPLAKPSIDDVSWDSPEPQEAPEFGSMVVKDIVSFLESWGPLKGDSSRSPDHVWSPFCRAVTEAPEKFCQEISEFQRVDPTYVKLLFRGLREALREDHSFTWNSVLGLAEWVANSGREIPGRSVEKFDWDADWGDTRVQIVDLVHAGLEARACGIPYELRELVWKVLRPLTDDPEPAPHREHEMIGPRKDPLPLAGGGHRLDSHRHPHGVAINTVRCLALRTVFQYARWVKHNLLAAASNDGQPVPCFAQMPEVREVLDYHVDSRNDGSIAIGYVYGTEFPLLYWLDRNWAEDNKTQIFSRAEGRQERGAAAWEGYLFNWTLDYYCDLFDVLKDEYDQAVEQLGRPASERGHFINPDLILGEQLRNFYLLSKIRLDSPESIWVRFFAKADDETLGELISGIGWEMCTQKEFSKLWLEQFRTLWNWRIDQIRSAKNPTSHRKELRAFGSWFASGKFEDVWALERLSEVLGLNGEIERADEVVNHLANLADRFPEQVLDCVTRMVKGVSRTAMLHYWNENLRKIVSITLGAEDQDVRQKCGALKSILVSNGMDEYAQRD